MKTMLLAAAAALSLGIGSAYAGDGDIPQADTFFTELPGVIAQAPAQNAPSVATAQNGLAVRAYVSNANRGTWLFQNNQDHEGANS
ncbi:MAG TPA: hypothetical protein VKI44_42630 [Acetobacteraceae bacterium]|nr:hypothetical protein [Acetobacteraceae bacterium]